ncbi:MAG: Hsp70 family protein [Syntrophomonadaceae bacterium]|jgi:molecular chaperone DnaK (HSP70)|nr:Hsp70 family protein [Syntrophomonadaceae bacterium]
MYYYGIDLGTTYSCIARADDDGNVEIIKNLEGKDITPSVVEFRSKDERAVGETAKAAMIINAENTVSFIKQKMGDSTYRFSFNGIEYPPEQISAFILKKLVEDAQKLTGDTITEAVITVPAYFGINERMATANAGKIAGLEVLGNVNEPTAAVIAYAAAHKDLDGKIVLIYDLGGGTFDVTIAEINGGNVTVICTNGDHSLGGKDWDAKVREFVTGEFIDATNADSADLNDGEFQSVLVVRTEEAKKQLTGRTSTDIPLRLDKDHKASIPLSREKFDGLTAGLLGRTIALTDEAISQAKNKISSKGVPCDKFDEIILVGGSARMPQVEEILKKKYGVTPKMFDFDLAVAMGAALIARMIKNPPPPEPGKSLSLGGGVEAPVVDVTSKSYGIFAIGDGDEKILSNVLLKNTPIPCSATKIYTTISANMSYVSVDIYESDTVDAAVDRGFGTKIADGELKLPPGLPKGAPIEVTFSLDRNGLLTLTAVELTHGMKCKVEVKVQGLSDAEVEGLAMATKSTRV